MEKKVILLSLLVSGLVSAQVGVNTDTPRTTLDVNAKRNTSGAITDNAQTVGLQAPRLTRLELSSLTATYGTNQNGALIYVTDIVGGNATGQRINVTSPGYYYFDSVANVWQKFVAGTVPSTSIEPWNVLGTANQATNNTDNIYQEGRVLIGFPNALTSSSPILPTTLVGQKLAVNQNFGIHRWALQPSMVLTRLSNLSATTPEAVTSGMMLGNIIFEGYNGTTRVATSQIRAWADTNLGVVAPGNGLNYGRFSFMTRGVDGEQERLGVNNLGNVGIGKGVVASPQNRLVVQGPVDAANGNPVAGEVDRSGVRLDNVKSAAYLATNADGDIIRTSAPGAPVEPWRVAGGTTEATLNTQSIYQSGSIGISSATNSTYFQSRAIPRALSIIGDGNASDDIQIQAFTGNVASSSGQVALMKTRGTVGAALPVVTGDGLGTLVFGGNVVTNADPTYIESASITGVVNGTVNGTNLPVDLQFNTGSANNPSEKMRITSAGDVGIGTTAPKQKLEVGGIVKARGLTNGNTTIGSTSDFGIYNSTNTWLRLATRGTDNGESGTSKIAFYTNATEASPIGVGATPAMVVDGGNVGINVASPATKLHIVAPSSGTGFRLQDTSQAQGNILVSDSNGNGSWQPSPFRATVLGTLNSTTRQVATGLNVGSSITLSRGKWLVNIGQLVLASYPAGSDNNMWMRLTLSSSSTTGQTSGFNFLTNSTLVSGWLGPASTSGVYSMLAGVIPIEITAQSATLYLRFGSVEKTSSFSAVQIVSITNSGENYFFATPLQ